MMRSAPWTAAPPDEALFAPSATYRAIVAAVLAKTVKENLGSFARFPAIPPPMRPRPTTAMFLIIIAPHPVFCSHCL